MFIRLFIILVGVRQISFLINKSIGTLQESSKKRPLINFASNRHCEGGTTEAICLIEGQIASAPTLNPNAWALQ